MLKHWPNLSLKVFNDLLNQLPALRRLLVLEFASVSHAVCWRNLVELRLFKQLNLCWWETGANDHLTAGKLYCIVSEL